MKNNISKQIQINLLKLSNIKLGGINTKDYPDFCDAYIEAADYNGRPMSDKKLDYLNSNHSDFVHEKVFDYLY